MKTKGPQYGDTFCLTLLTNDPILAESGDRAGIDRIGIDLERAGKRERQAGTNGRLSQHELEDLARIAPRVRRAQLFVRLNPIHAGTGVEIETALEMGARVLMLPYFGAAGEVACFTGLIRTGCDSAGNGARIDAHSRDPCSPGHR
jgi:hypothetical protein